VTSRRAVVVAIAAAALTALALTGCGDGGSSGPVTLRIYVSAPLQGARGAKGEAVQDGARLALADAGGRVGRFHIRGVYLDDSDARGWTIARTAANARRAAQDTAAIGYVGDLDSGATKVSLPITNQAEIAQVSPGSGAVDLTRLSSAGGSDPDRYRPSDRQSFARVVPADDVVARAAAIWAKRERAQTFAASGDRTAFGRITEDAFASEARALGMRPFTSADTANQFPTAGDKPPGPDAVWFGLSSLPASSGFEKVLLPALSSLIFAPETISEPAFLRRIAAAQDQLRIVSAFLDPSLLPAGAKPVLREFRSRFKRPPPPAAAYGYEAMALLLDAIRRAGDEGDSRAAVIDALLSTTERRSILGTYSLDGNGDTTLDAVTGYRIGDGIPVFPVRLTAPR
jgi:branched-chain amino acid transport system substrate-binding protein